MFGGAGREYRWKYGTKRETFAKIAEKARKHAAKNPFALFRDELSVEEIMASPEIFDPLTRFQCCPPTCGVAAAILCSDEFAKKHDITNPVWIAAQTMTTGCFMRLLRSAATRPPFWRSDRSVRTEVR